MAGKKKGGDWLESLQATGLTVQSARDALQVKGWLDTGCYALNWALSGRLLRGYPLGHTGELFGDPGTGKSFLIARAIAMVQRMGGVALLDDTECAYNAEHAVKLGVNVDALAHRSSRTVKEHLATAQAFVKAFKKTDLPAGVLACDSLSQLSTDHELKEQLNKRDMTKAAELKAFYRIIGGDLFNLPVVHLATSHTIANIGNPFQSRTTSGGGGPKFTSTFRIDLRATSKIRAGTGAGAEIIGVICRAVVEKNRLVAPWKEVRLAIPFNQPISKASGLIPLLQSLGVVEEAGSFLLYDGQKLGRAYKTKDRILEQDEVGERMLDQYPQILEEVDRGLEAGRFQSTGAPKEEAFVAAESDEDNES